MAKSPFIPIRTFGPVGRIRRKLTRAQLILAVLWVGIVVIVAYILSSTRCGNDFLYPLLYPNVPKLDLAQYAVDGGAPIKVALDYDAIVGYYRARMEVDNIAVSRGDKQTAFFFVTAATRSMQPALPAGSITIFTDEPYAEIRVGDIVQYYNPYMREFVVHRVVKKEQGCFYAKGDNNPFADEDSAGRPYCIPNEYIKGRLAAVLYRPVEVG